MARVGKSQKHQLLACRRSDKQAAARAASSRTGIMQQKGSAGAWRAPSQPSGTAGSTSGTGRRSQRVKGPMTEGSSHGPVRTARTNFSYVLR